MTDEYSVCLRISGPASNNVESFIHEIIKRSDEGHRFGVDLDVERIDDPSEESTDFSNEH